MSQTQVEQAPATPGWVKVSGIIALVVIVLLGIILLSGGEHGPGRHMPSVSTTQVHTPLGQHSGQ